MAFERKLVIVNNGPARAEGVNLTVEDLNVSPFMQGELEEWLPVGLEPGQEFPLSVTLTADSEPIIDVTLTWSDGLGEQSKVVTIGLV